MSGMSEQRANCPVKTLNSGIITVFFCCFFFLEREKVSFISWFCRRKLETLRACACGHAGTSHPSHATHAHTHAHTPLRPYSILSWSCTIKDGGSSTDSLWFLSSEHHPVQLYNLSDSAAWPIGPVWQPPDALSGSSPPSLSCAHIPPSRGPIANVINSLENGERQGSASELYFVFVPFLQGNFIITPVHANINGSSEIITISQTKLSLQFVVKSLSLWLFSSVIIAGNGSLAVQPRGLESF